MNEQTQGKVVHLLALGKGKRLAHETTQALAQGAVPALDVAGLPLAFVAQAMRALGEDLLVRQPEVAAAGPAAIVRRDAFSQGPDLAPVLRTSRSAG